MGPPVVSGRPRVRRAGFDDPTPTAPEELPPPIRLPGHRTLVVRRLTAGDVDGLRDLYDQLSPDDRYLRFFSFYRPSDDFLCGMVGRGAQQGAGLAAIVVAPEGQTLVAEATYTVLPNGNGEFGMTVARPWRGWLGPYLLRILLDVAAARGVRRLESDVLARNRPMLTLLRAQGATTLARPDWTVVRLVVDTARHRQGRREGPLAPSRQGLRAARSSS